MVQANVRNMLPVKRKKVVSGDWEQGTDSDESLDVDAVVSGITSHQQVKKKGRDESRYSAFDAQSLSDLHGQNAAAFVSKPKRDDGRGKAPQVDHAKQVKSDQVRRDALRKNAEALKQKQLMIKKALTAVVRYVRYTFKCVVVSVSCFKLFIFDVLVLEIQKQPHLILISRASNLCEHMIYV